MPTIHCPNCKRVLRSPEAGSERGVTCPGCGITFQVVIEPDGLRVDTNPAFAECLPESPSDLDPSPTGVEPPPEWLPPVATGIENDEARRRTRRLNWIFFLGWIGLFLVSLATGTTYETNGKFSGSLLLGAVFGSLLGACIVTAILGFFITPSSVDAHRQGADVLAAFYDAGPPVHPGRSEWVRVEPDAAPIDLPSESIAPREPPS